MEMSELKEALESRIGAWGKANVHIEALLLGRVDEEGAPPEDVWLVGISLVPTNRRGVVFAGQDLVDQETQALDVDSVADVLATKFKAAVLRDHRYRVAS